MMVFHSPNLFAEFYKYKDSTGVLRFTDNLSEVPENQRKSVDKYKEYVPPPPPVEDIDINDLTVDTTTKPEPQKSIKIPLNQQSQKDQKSLKIQVLGNKISTIKENLEKEYQQLLKEKKSLEALDKKPGKKKSTDIALLQKKADQLNKKINAYNQKKTTYLKAIKKYQEKIKLLR
jgi:membrane-associated HD superfamily phosphohydrolase